METNSLEDGIEQLEVEVLARPGNHDEEHLPIPGLNYNGHAG